MINQATDLQDAKDLTRLDDRGAWILTGTVTSELPLYEEDQVRLDVAAGEVVWVMESESSVDALIRLGHYATTWAGGSGNPPLGKLAAVLAHAIDVRIIADNDDHGRGQACALRIHAALSEAGIPTTCWIPPTVGTDVRDLINAGGSLADLAPLASPIAQSEEAVS